MSNQSKDVEIITMQSYIYIRYENNLCQVLMKVLVRTREEERVRNRVSLPGLVLSGV